MIQQRSIINPNIQSLCSKLKSNAQHLNRIPRQLFIILRGIRRLLRNLIQLQSCILLREPSPKIIRIFYRLNYLKFYSDSLIQPWHKEEIGNSKFIRIVLFSRYSRLILSLFHKQEYPSFRHQWRYIIQRITQTLIFVNITKSYCYLGVIWVRSWV